MQIVIHCSGMAFNGDTIKHKSLGGSETAAYYMAKEFAAMGHNVTLFTNSTEEGVFDRVNYVFLGSITNEAPLGDRFHYFAMNTPHDVCIVQRHPIAFSPKWASKFNVLWLHDLAHYRSKYEFTMQAWNVNMVWTVSEFHKNQVNEVYGFTKDIITPVTNGIDPALYDVSLRNGKDDYFKINKNDNCLNMLYSSRPERGLENLVGPEGIMRKLDAGKFKLFFCAYDNVVPQMAGYYKQLWDWASELPNVVNLGNLTKQQLADVQSQIDCYMYPTEFEEVSCITAMEAMASSTPFISSEYAALPETCKDSGSILIPLKDGKADIDKFVEKANSLFDLKNAVEYMYEGIGDLKQLQIDAAQKYYWSNAAINAMASIESRLSQLSYESTTRLARHYMRYSDIAALKHLIDNDIDLEDIHDKPILANVIKEYHQCYEFYKTGSYQDHYSNYYQYEKDRGVVYGKENLDGNSRFESVSDIISQLPTGFVVLDYGCAHGHYTNNLAKRFPHLYFLGVDIEKTNIEAAKKWKSEDGITNVEFVQGTINEEGRLHLINVPAEKRQHILTLKFGGIVAAEVVEHVPNPQFLVDNLSNHLHEHGVMCITVPFGPWEAEGYIEHWPWRAHLHHFERSDLREMFGKHPNYSLLSASAGVSSDGELMGSYIVIFKKPKQASGSIDYHRKHIQQNPRQTVSACLIVKDAAGTIQTCLKSIVDVCDEINVGIDKTTTDNTASIIDEFSTNYPNVVFNTITITSPIETGFSIARNSVLELCTGDWVVWIDSDEVMIDSQKVCKYLKGNQFDSLGVAQHHFTVQPLGVIKTDYPCRFFKNTIGAKFHGLVHEHPEIELNKGLGSTLVIPDVCISHHGYTTETIRRKRFERNIKLLFRDRGENPTRILGKFLFTRDLAQMCNYDLEKTGNQVTQQMVMRAVEGMNIFEEILNEAMTANMIIEALPYYSVLTGILRGGADFDFSVVLRASKDQGANLQNEKVIGAHFHNRDHLDRLLKRIIDERVNDYGKKYY